MNKQAVNNPYTEDWQKELEAKSYEDLIRIVAYEENYNPEFIQMAKAKLEASEHYNEDEVQSQIEEIRKEPLPKQKDPADTLLKVANIGCLTLKAIVVFMVVIVAIAAGINSSAMNNGMKGVMATIMFGICLGIYELGKHFWKTRNKKGRSAG